MLLVLSPSKTLDFESKPATDKYTQPDFLKESQALIKELRNYTPARLSKLMDISDKLAALNAARYQEFHTPFTPGNARQAILAFKGDVYEGLAVEHYKAKDFRFAQDHLRILSGLYGLLRPLDLIQPYRLEMGIRLKNARGRDLYAFWGDRITEALNEAMLHCDTRWLVNLASEEYFKAIRPEKLAGTVIHIVFKENQNGKLKVIALFAKKARGRMASFMIRNKIVYPEDLKDFAEDGYRYQATLSDKKTLVFMR